LTQHDFADHGDGQDRERPVRPFVIQCDAARLAALQPGQSVSASSRVFWSSAGFAFERPGRYRVTVAVDWSAQGVHVGLDDSIDLFVDYPASDADNHLAGLVLHPEVGKWVALGGGAYHLREASRRLHHLSALTGGDAQPRALHGFAALLPNRDRLAVIHPDIVGETAGDRGGSRPRRRPGHG
jgi:hypothetical protein